MRVVRGPGQVPGQALQKQGGGGGFFRTLFGSAFSGRKGAPHPADGRVARSGGSFANLVRREASEAAAQLAARVPSSPALLHPAARAPPPQPAGFRDPRGGIPAPGPVPAPRAQPSNAPAGPSSAAAASRLPSGADAEAGPSGAGAALEEAQRVLDDFMDDAGPPGRALAPLLSRSGRTIAVAPDRDDAAPPEGGEHGRERFPYAQGFPEEPSADGAEPPMGGRPAFPETRAFGSDISAATSPTVTGSRPGSGWSSRPGSAADDARGASFGDEQAGGSSSGASTEGRGSNGAGPSHAPNCSTV